MLPVSTGYSQPLPSRTGDAGSFIWIVALLFNELVRKGGLEPPQCCHHWNLNPARLPIPPLPQAEQGTEKATLQIRSLSTRVRTQLAGNACTG